MTLESHGYSVFWDHKSIPMGRSWQQTIAEELSSCKCIIVVWSKNSVKSEWVLEEALEGKRKGILLPIKIDDVSPPFGFGMHQVGDFVRENNNFDSLLKIIRINFFDTKEVNTKEVNKYSTLRKNILFLTYLSPLLILVIFNNYIFDKVNYYYDYLIENPRSVHIVNAQTTNDTVTRSVNLINKIDSGDSISPSEENIEALRKIYSAIQDTKKDTNECFISNGLYSHMASNGETIMSVINNCGFLLKKPASLDKLPKIDANDIIHISLSGEAEIKKVTIYKPDGKYEIIGYDDNPPNQIFKR